MNDKKDRATLYTGDMIPGILLPNGEITPGTRSRRTLRLRNALVASSFELAGKRVLDVGCAEGRQSLNLADRALEVVGVDHRASQIRVASNTAAALGMTNVRFEAADIRDPGLFDDVGKFDLAIAWGFLHRIGDIFALLYSLEPITNAISLEWRTPVLPLMSEMSLAYHPKSSKELDPMNTGRAPEGAIKDEEKIEGGASFWEPTPGAVKAILARLGYKHATLIGYEDDLVSEDVIMGRWYEHEAEVKAGRRRASRLPQARVHMLFEKVPGSIQLVSKEAARARLPKWDHALLESTKGGRRPVVMRAGKPQPAPPTILRRLARVVLPKLGLGSRTSRKTKPAKDGPKAAAKKPSSDTKGDRGSGYVVDKEALTAAILAQAPAVFANAVTHPGGDASLVDSQGIQISSLDLSNLSIVTYSSAQLAMRLDNGSPLPRAIFRDEQYFYKIWRHDYRGHREIYLRGERNVLPPATKDGVEQIWAFHVGLFDEVCCPAFAGAIYSGTRLVGYRTKVGTPVARFSKRDPQHRAFIERLNQNTLTCGIVYSDLRTPNLVQLPDGRISLIDFDGYLLVLQDFVSGVETGRGWLRPKTIRAYMDLIGEFANPMPWQQDLQQARENAKLMSTRLAAVLREPVVEL